MNVSRRSVLKLLGLTAMAAPLVSLSKEPGNVEKVYSGPYSLEAALRGALLGLPGVKDAHITFDLASYAFECHVMGGNPDEIANCIWEHKPADILATGALVVSLRHPRLDYTAYNAVGYTPSVIKRNDSLTTMTPINQAGLIEHVLL